LILAVEFTASKTIITRNWRKDWVEDLGAGERRRGRKARRSSKKLLLSVPRKALARAFSISALSVWNSL